MNTLEFSPFVSFPSGFFIATAFLANLYTLHYVKFKLKTNAHISRLLLMSTIAMTVPMMMLIVGFLSLVVLSIVEFWTCSLIVIPHMMMFMVGTLSTASISGSRIYMARKTASSETIRHDLIKGLSYIGFFSIMAGITMISYANLGKGEPFSPVILECAGLESSKFGLHNALFVAPISILSITGLILSIVYDVKMINFIRERNRGNDIELMSPEDKTRTVWNVNTFRSGAVQMSIGVPLKATAISTFGVIFVLAIIALVVTIKDKLVVLETMFMIGVIKNCYQMPLMLAFVVKSKDRVKPVQKTFAMPQGLQYHD